MNFDEFLKEVCHRFDLDWRKYRRHAARKHLDTRLRELGLGDYESYIDLLQRDAAETERLPDLLRVTVSRFFREREHWDFLAERVLPELLAQKRDGPLRAWCAGCCNGEEPYSLALLFLWMAGRDNSAPVRETGIEILATDIDPEVLERAREGVYGRSSLRELPDELAAKHFDRRGDEYRLHEEVRRIVRFELHNLREDEPPSRIDLLLCRYLVFTYYTGKRRLQAAERLWRSLAPGGFLMVGRKDRLGPRELELFEPWEGSSVFFRNRAPRQSNN